MSKKLTLQEKYNKLLKAYEKKYSRAIDYGLNPKFSVLKSPEEFSKKSSKNSLSKLEYESEKISKYNRSQGAKKAAETRKSKRESRDNDERDSRDNDERYSRDTNEPSYPSNNEPPYPSNDDYYDDYYNDIDFDNGYSSDDEIFIQNLKDIINGAQSEQISSFILDILNTCLSDSYSETMFRLANAKDFALELATTVAFDSNPVEVYNAADKLLYLITGSNRYSKELQEICFKNYSRKTPRYFKI